MSAHDRLQQYGIASWLAQKAEDAGLTTSKIRNLSIKNLTSNFGMSSIEASELKKCIVRKPINGEIAEILLSRSNHVCCVCKGEKGSGVIIHHIIEYEKSQDNNYDNLAVLCPNDHDRAHQTGLTLGLTIEQIRKSKINWEKQVEIQNVQRAAITIDVNSEAIDYVNVMRLEEICIQRFGFVPATTISHSLRQAGILGSELRFDEKFVREHIAGKKYLFDYINSGETNHYRQLMEKISAKMELADLSEAARSGIRKLTLLEGKYAYFIGGVSSKRPRLPISASQPLDWKYRLKNVEIIWNGDAKYLVSMSAISRQGSLNRYLIYCLVRTVTKSQNKIKITCSPLLIAQPKTYIERTPVIAWQRFAEKLNESAMDDEDTDKYIDFISDV